MGVRGGLFGQMGNTVGKTPSSATEFTIIPAFFLNWEGGWFRGITTTHNHNSSAYDKIYILNVNVLCSSTEGVIR